MPMSGFDTGLASIPAFMSIGLCQNTCFPSCSPSLRDGAPGLRNLSDLAHHTVLQDENLNFGDSSPTWEFWAREAGVTLPEPVRTRRLGQSNLVIQAAIEGLGVALGREPLVVDALNEGKLVRPFSEIVSSPLSYWLVCRSGMLESAKVQEFLTWIKAEAANQPSIPGSAREND